MQESGRAIAGIIGIAALLTLLHIAVAILAFNGGINIPFAYKKLYQGDGKHYAHIVDNGYRAIDLTWPFEWRQGSTKMIEEKTNVAFFPGYPLLSLLVQTITGLVTNYSLLLSSQLMSIVFWTYFILLCRSYGATKRMTLGAVVTLWTFATSFFLITSMSESLFFATLLGMIYWSGRPGRTAFLLSILHGSVMTATRVFGFALSALCLLPSLVSEHIESRKAKRATLMMVGSLAGIGIFFLFCQVMFGHWNLYFAAQEQGWDVQTAPLFFLSPRVWELLNPWSIAWPTFIDGNGVLQEVQNNREGRFLASFFTWWLLLWPLVEWQTHRKNTSASAWRERAPLYLGALVSMYLILVPVWNMELQSVIRYILLPLVFATLTVTHWYARLKPIWWRSAFLGIVTVFVVYNMSLKLKMIKLYMLGDWVG